MILVQNYEIITPCNYIYVISMYLCSCDQWYGVPFYTVLQGNIIAVMLDCHWYTSLKLLHAKTTTIFTILCATMLQQYNNTLCLTLALKSGTKHFLLTPKA